jgi:hypothetical protein
MRFPAAKASLVVIALLGTGTGVAAIAFYLQQAWRTAAEAAAENDWLNKVYWRAKDQGEDPEKKVDEARELLRRTKTALPAVDAQARRSEPRSKPQHRPVVLLPRSEAPAWPGCPPTYHNAQRRLKPLRWRINRLAWVRGHTCARPALVQAAARVNDAGASPRTNDHREKQRCSSRKRE